MGQRKGFFVMWPIYVCSKARPHDRHISTMRLLRDAGVPFNLVVEPQDAAVYEEAWPDAVVLVLPENDRGLAYCRNFVIQHAASAGHAWVWVMDDDVKRFCKQIGKKAVTVPVNDLLAEAEAAAVKYTDLPFMQIGLSYVQNVWSAKTTVRLNGPMDVVVAFHVAALGGFRYDETLSLKSDREFTLRLLGLGYCNVTLTTLGFDCPTNGSNAGGLQDVYRAGVEAECVQRLATMYPGVVTRHVKPSGRVDAKINWKMFRGKGRA